MKIFFSYSEKKYSIKFLRKKRAWITACIKEEGYSLNLLRFIFCTDDFLIKINQEFLNHNYYTDVISFSYGKDKIIEGEIYVSIDRIKDNCKIFNISFDEELNRILIHGVLHLMNYKDGSKKLRRIMTGKEDYYLQKF